MCTWHSALIIFSVYALHTPRVQATKTRKTRPLSEPAGVRVELSHYTTCVSYNPLPYRAMVRAQVPTTLSEAGRVELCGRCFNIHLHSYVVSISIDPRSFALAFRSLGMYVLTLFVCFGRFLGRTAEGGLVTLNGVPATVFRRTWCTRGSP